MNNLNAKVKSVLYLTAMYMADFMMQKLNYLNLNKLPIKV